MNFPTPPAFKPLAFTPRVPRGKAFAFALALALSATAAAQTDIYRQIAIPEALHLQQNLALSSHIYSAQQITKDIKLERLSFTTQYGMSVPAIAYVPTHIKAKAPAIVIVAGHGGDKTSWYEVYAGLLYASAGAIVLTYDPAGEDERNPTRLSDTRLHDQPTALKHPEAIGGLMVQDVLQAERYLAHRSDVDPGRIAILGYSMGTFHAAIATALARENTRALLLSAGGNLDAPGQYWETGNKLNCQVAPYKALNAAMEGHAGDLLYEHIAEFTPTLVMNGTADGLITKFNEQQPWFDALRDRVHNALLPTEHLPETIFYKDVGHRPSFVNRDAALWLNHQLHFPNWTDAQIAAFPTITAHEWSTRNGVPINKPYDTAASEGGVEALDLKLPGIPRSQLQALPEAEWQRHHTSFTFDTWLGKALSSESATKHFLYNRRMFKALAALALVAALTAHTQSPSPQREHSSTDYTFVLTPHAKPMRVHVDLADDKTITTISVFRAGQIKPFQIFPPCVGATLQDLSEIDEYPKDLVSHADLNFDGFQDLEVLTFYSMHLDKRVYCVYLWNDKAQRFTPAPKGSPEVNLKPHPKTKTVTEYDGWMGGAYEERTYRWTGSRFRLIKTKGHYDTIDTPK